LRYPRYAPGACSGRSLSVPVTEQTVWEHVQALLADPEILRQLYEQGRGDPAIDVEAEHERVRLERRLSALEREKTRLVDAYQAGVIALAELAEWRQRLSEQGQLLRRRVEEIEQQRLDRSAELRLLEGVEAFCASVRVRWRHSLLRSSRKCYSWSYGVLWWRITAFSLSTWCRVDRFGCNRNVKLSLTYYTHNPLLAKAP